jgi:hypothetical protein
MDGNWTLALFDTSGTKRAIDLVRYDTSGTKSASQEK